MAVCDRWFLSSHRFLFENFRFINWAKASAFEAVHHLVLVNWAHIRVYVMKVQLEILVFMPLDRRKNRLLSWYRVTLKRCRNLIFNILGKLWYFPLTRPIFCNIFARIPHAFPRLGELISQADPLCPQLRWPFPHQAPLTDPLGLCLPQHLDRILQLTKFMVQKLILLILVPK